MNILGFMLPSTDFLLIVPLFPILLPRHARLLTFTFCSLLSNELPIINYGEGYHPKLTAKSSELYFSTIAHENEFAHGHMKAEKIPPMSE